MKFVDDDDNDDDDDDDDDKSVGLLTRLKSSMTHISLSSSFK